jgi:hypothetical protein
MVTGRTHLLRTPTESRLQATSPLPPSPISVHARPLVGLVNADVGKTPAVIILGLILLLIGIIVGVPILTTIGVILLIVGVVLYILGATGRAVGGRNHYW